MGTGTRRLGQELERSVIDLDKDNIPGNHCGKGQWTVKAEQSSLT